jgi:protein-disulfide isomerase
LPKHAHADHHPTVEVDRARAGKRDHVRGPVEAPITLVEYGDLECPFCEMAYPIFRELVRRLGNRLRVVFRHFPLRDQHPHTQHAAEATEAAAAQGKFWELHDLLFEHQQALDDAQLSSTRPTWAWILSGSDAS